MQNHQSLETGAPRQRVSAAGHVASKRHAQRDKQSVIAALDQQGSARIRFPNTHRDALQAVLLNTAGGLTGGDIIRWSATAKNDSHLRISTAACEKLYRTHGPNAVQNTELAVENSARLDWLPQETIVFNASALQRKLTVQLADEATALLVESFVLGRQAMLESVSQLNLHDQWRIFRAGKLLHAEDFRLKLDEKNNAQQQSILHQYSAFSTVVLVSPKTTESLKLLANQVQRLIPQNTASIRAAASVMPHRLVVRVLADSSFSLRSFLIPCIEQLNENESIPQVWNV